MGDLYDSIRAHLDLAELEPSTAEATGRAVRIAVVGRPNAGKSTLINRMIGRERLLTGPEAGITRDAIAVDWTWRDRDFRLFDTAGLRRKTRVDGKLEKLSVGDALRAIRFAEIVILVLDALQPFEKQDLQIADLVESEGRAVVIALDKWDLVDNRQRAFAAIREKAGRLLPQIRGVALVPVSGLTGEGIDRLMAAAVQAHEVWNRRLPTAGLNRWLEKMVARHPPPAVSGRRIKLRYLTQPKARPPTFVAFCSRPEKLPAAWQRYLVNALREDFELPGTPIRLMLRKGDNPYAGRKRRS
jgi:GTP-binding protein